MLPMEAKDDLGKLGATMPEISAEQAVKAEKEMHRQFEQWLRMKELPFGTSRMDRKSSYTVGWPDYTVCVNGRVVFLELKMPGQNLDPEQVIVCGALIAQGASVSVCSSLQQCIEIVKAFMLSPQSSA